MLHDHVKELWVIDGLRGIVIAAGFDTSFPLARHGVSGERDDGQVLRPRCFRISRVASSPSISGI